MSNDSIPRAPNCGRFLAETNDGRLLYLNHANEWQEMPNILASDATTAPTSGSEDGGKERIFDENGIDMTAVERALADAHVGGVSVTFNDVWAIIGSYQSAALAKPASESAGGEGVDDLVSRAEVLRVIRSLGDQDSDLALYGAADNARAREYGEAAATRACCAIALMPAALSSSAGPAVEAETLWCESCGEAPMSVRLDEAGLCAACAKEQGE